MCPPVLVPLRLSSPKDFSHSALGPTLEGADNGFVAIQKLSDQFDLCISTNLLFFSLSFCLVSFFTSSLCVTDLHSVSSLWSRSFWADETFFSCTFFLSSFWCFFFFFKTHNWVWLLNSFHYIFHTISIPTSICWSLVRHAFYEKILKWYLDM